MTTTGETPERVSPHDGAPSKIFEPDDAFRSVTVLGRRPGRLSRGCSTTIAGTPAELARL